MDWSRYANFVEAEFVCSHTGKVFMQELFMDRLQSLRNMLQIPLIIVSGYRDPSHPVERVKPVPGTHTMGRAADIRVFSAKTRHSILFGAESLGFTGFGIGPDFIHLDDLGRDKIFGQIISVSPYRPVVWHYYHKR